MKTKIKLSVKEIVLLEELASRSKMDCWFSIDEKGNVRDREKNNRVISTRNAVKELIDGLTEYDVEMLEKEDFLVLLNLAKRL